MFFALSVHMVEKKCYASARKGLLPFPPATAGEPERRKMTPGKNGAKHVGTTSTLSDDDPRLYAEQVKLLYRNLPVGLIAAIINAVILLFSQWSVVEHRALVLWFGSIALITLLRCVMFVHWRFSEITIRNAPIWGFRFAVGTAVSGLAWGSAGVFLFPADLAHQIFVIFVLAGMTAGAIASFSALLKVAVLFLLPALMPLTLRLLFEGQDMHMAMGAMSLVFMGLMLVTARRVYETTLESLRLRFENTDLLEVLAKEKEATETLNVDLKREIFERRRIEQGLRESESRVRAVVDHVLDGIITINDDGIMESVNPAAERIFGYTADKMIGQHFTRLVPEADRAEYQDYLKKHLMVSRGRPIGFGLEITGQLQDGSTFPMELGLSHMWIDGRYIFIGIIRDITERKNIEQMKDRFVSVVSHELRTPLTSALGSLGLFAEGVAGELSEKGQNLLTIARTNMERLVRLINDILGMNDVQSGKLQLRQAPIEIAALLERSIQFDQMQAANSGVSITLKCETPDLWVYADYNRLFHAVNHLISNAVKFSPRKGSVEIAVTEHTNMVRVSVTDHGSGIPVANRDKIFLPFADTELNERSSLCGAGLGLSIAKAIVEKHGGRIDFTTELNVGTCFYFDLPIWQERIDVETKRVAEPRS